MTADPNMAAAPPAAGWDQIQPGTSHEIEIDRLFSEILIPCWPDLVTTKVLQLMLSDRESAENYGTILKFDLRLQELIMKFVNSMGLDKVIEDPAHAVSIIGVEQVRDIVIGRGIYYSFYHEDSEEPFEPQIADFANYVNYARKSQKVARILKNPYPELAYAGGVLFDFLKGKLDTLMAPEYDDVESPTEFLENVYKRSVRAGIASVLVSEYVTLAHKRFAFITGLVHNIGKLVLYAYDPAGYVETIKYIKESKHQSSDEEIRRFGIDHAQAGALYLGQLKFLGEIERAVDFHHSNWLCKFENVPIYHFAGLIHVGAHIVRSVKEKGDIINNPQNPFFQREEFLCLGLNLADFIRIQKKYLKLKDFEELPGMADE